jgi:Rho-binding antiterminator
MKEYIPVSCKLYDEFEAVATKKEECELVYLEDEVEKAVDTKIVDFKSFEKQEFMIIQDGTVIRLDRIISFNGTPTKILNCY